MTTLRLKAKVGPDGVLTLSIPLGPAEADREVDVIIEHPAPSPKPAMTQQEWEAFLDRTAGSITDPTFERPDQGEFERRDSLS